MGQHLLINISISVSLGHDLERLPILSRSARTRSGGVENTLQLEAGKTHPRRHWLSWREAGGPAWGGCVLRRSPSAEYALPASEGACYLLQAPVSRPPPEFPPGGTIVGFARRGAGTRLSTGSGCVPGTARAKVCELAQRSGLADCHCPGPLHWVLAAVGTWPRWVVEDAKFAAARGKRILADEPRQELRTAASRPAVSHQPSAVGPRRRSVASRAEDEAGNWGITLKETLFGSRLGSWGSRRLAPKERGLHGGRHVKV
jgi:hypothetical protein